MMLMLTMIKGYEVKYFSSGEEVLEHLPTLITMQPSLIICEYELPGINGIDLSDRLHAYPALSHVPILLTTTYDKAMMYYKIGKRQIQFITKPFIMDTFLYLVDHTIQTNPQEQTPN